MTAIAKSSKRHPAAKKCCGWEEPAIWKKITLHSTLLFFAYEELDLVS